MRPRATSNSATARDTGIHGRNYVPAGIQIVTFRCLANPCRADVRAVAQRVRILVVEDEVGLAGHLKRALTNGGRDAHAVHDGRTGLAEARSGKYDLIVLDIALPALCGLEVLKQLRAEGIATRVLMLTARSEVPDKVTAFRTGADDYLAKPFAMNELLARINAIGRRYLAPCGSKLQVGDLTLVLGEREARCGERRIPLSEREYALLHVLMREPDRVFSRAELSERVWAREHEYDARLVEVYVSRLRRKIDEESNAPRLIHTVRHLGYTIRVDQPAEADGTARSTAPHY